MDIYKQYADIRKEVDKLKEVEESLRLKVLEEMEKDQIVKEEFEYGKFTVGSRKTYKYTSKVKELEERVQLAKLKEIEKGVAKVQETKYLIFKGK